MSLKGELTPWNANWVHLDVDVARVFEGLLQGVPSDAAGVDTRFAKTLGERCGPLLQGGTFVGVIIAGYTIE